MTPDSPLTARAAEVLSKEAHEQGVCSSRSDARVISAIAEAIRRNKRRRHQRRMTIAGAVAVAAALLLALGATAPTRHRAVAVSSTASSSAAPLPERAAPVMRVEVHGTAAVVRAGVTMELSGGDSLRADDHVVVENGEVTVHFAQGTRVAVHSRSELTLTSTAPEMRFELVLGAVDIDVAPLVGAQRFVLHSGDDEIEVHGTSFEVRRVQPDPACGGGTATRVGVREGVVSVRSAGSEAFVHRGETWPDCTTTALAPNARPAAPVPAPRPTPVLASPTPSTTTASSAAPSRATKASDLAAQNDLYELASTRKRAGDTAGALRAFDELLTRFPSSYLGQSTRAERMRLLRGVDREQAAAAARDYLARYPTGFARNDAELILSTP